jgi:hypothetical protein
MNMLTVAQKNAIDSFRKCYKRNWKAQLRAYWYNALIWIDDNGDANSGYILHGLRNTHGPSWLAKYKG